jgi:hypothetical protein
MLTGDQVSDQEEPEPRSGGEMPQPGSPVKPYGELLRETLTTAGRDTRPRLLPLPARLTAEHPFLVLPSEEEWAAAGHPPLLIRSRLPRSYGGTAT